MELIALAVPWVLLTLVVVTIGFLWFKKWKVALCLFLVGLYVNWYWQVVSVGGCNVADGGKGFKVMSWNCNLTYASDGYKLKNYLVADRIAKEDADVVFVTENFCLGKDVLGLLLADQFPYRVHEHNVGGNAVYSKLPIVRDTLMTSKDSPYAISYIVLRYDDVLFDVYGCHLSSNNYNERMEYLTPDSICNHSQIKNYLSNILSASEQRVKQAEIIVRIGNELFGIAHDEDGISRPTIVMGDMNDVCGSPTLRRLESSGFRDAWCEGRGYGATIHHPLPYRIDHILYRDGTSSSKSSRNLKLKSIMKIDADGLSDHDALVAEFEIKK